MGSCMVAKCICACTFPDHGPDTLLFQLIGQTLVIKAQPGPAERGYGGMQSLSVKARHLSCTDGDFLLVYLIDGLVIHQDMPAVCFFGMSGPFCTASGGAIKPLSRAQH